MSYINLCPTSVGYISLLVILVYVLHSFMSYISWLYKSMSYIHLCPMSVGYISLCLTLIYVLYQLVILVYVLH